MSNVCVIFDLDGTLVDSERQSSQAFLDLLPELGEPVDALVRRYRGMRLAPVLADIEARLGRKLPEEFTPSYRRRVAELFDQHLEPMPGAMQLLGALGVTFCIASAGPMEKIRHSLGRTGLAPYFGERVFSSYVVGSWKPEPGLFLHAAHALGFAPENCIVVEDSDPGLVAAKAAGMRSIHFAPDDIASSVECHARVTDLLEIPELLQQIAPEFER